VSIPSEILRAVCDPNGGKIVLVTVRIARRIDRRSLSRFRARVMEVRFFIGVSTLRRCAAFFTSTPRDMRWLCSIS